METRIKKLKGLARKLLYQMKFSLKEGISNELLLIRELYW